MKETIYYKKKKIALPFKDADYSDEPLEEVSIANRFNGESVMAHEPRTKPLEVPINVTKTTETSQWNGRTYTHTNIERVDNS